MSSPSLAPLVTIIIGPYHRVRSRSRRVILTRELARFSVVHRCVQLSEAHETCSRARVVERSFGDVVGNWRKSSKSARVCRSVDDTVVPVLLEGLIVASASLVAWLMKFAFTFH